jgi:hypothetical protein
MDMGNPDLWDMGCQVLHNSQILDRSVDRTLVHTQDHKDHHQDSNSKDGNSKGSNSKGSNTQVLVHILTKGCVDMGGNNTKDNLTRFNSAHVTWIE